MVSHMRLSCGGDAAGAALRFYGDAELYLAVLPAPDVITRG